MSRDVETSVRFFEKLGFTCQFQDQPADPKYACLTRDGVELHLQWQDESQWAYPIDRPTYRFLARDPDALHAEFQESGALAEKTPSSSPWLVPGDTPWGTREFHVRDPDGNGLQFYRPL
jgi:catechol 2,3-dioxygenase-like lactoylglutathione lyase family enzyme